MTTPSNDQVALHIASKARRLAIEAEAFFIVSSDPATAALGLERMAESLHGIAFWIEWLKQSAAK